LIFPFLKCTTFTQDVQILKNDEYILLRHLKFTVKNLTLISPAIFESLHSLKLGLFRLQTPVSRIFHIPTLVCIFDNALIIRQILVIQMNSPYIPCHFYRNSSLLISFIFLHACASITTSVGFVDEDEDDYFSSELIVEPVIATKTDAEMVEKDDDDEYAAVIEQRETFNSSKAYWRAAIKYLQNGNEDDARWALEQALILKPTSKIALDLMEQLDVDAINALGAEYFEYKVQYGDSLSKLSKYYLNDPLKFHLLAKYNDIENPTRLVVGQVIHIPGKQLIVAKDDIRRSNKTNKPKSHVVRSTLFVDAYEMFTAGEYISVIELIKKSQINLTPNPKLEKLLTAAYIKEGEQLIGNDQWGDAKTLLLNASILDPENAEINIMLIELSERDQVETVYQQSVKALDAHDPVKAYQLINQVLELQPNDISARNKKDEIKRLLIDFYYKKALMSQRKHQLEVAISFWNEVLDLDKYNDNAKLYRAKAVRLKAKLNKFVSSQ